MQCSNCDSNNIKNAGVLIRGKSLTRYRQYLCNDCGHRGEYAEGITYERSDKISEKKAFVVTSALNNKSIDKDFLKVLKFYSQKNSMELVVIPTRYIHAMEGEDVWYPPEIREFLLDDNITIGNSKCKILGGLRISATAENPLSGIDPMSKGYSLIIGHPQVQMKTLPVIEGDAPIIWTTGTITENVYSDTKLGYKAAFNHSASAIVVYVDSENEVHMRNLNYDGTGFNDLEYRYEIKGNAVTRKTQSVEALITGDEHALLRDKWVEELTYQLDDSIVKVLKPRVIVRHDLLDCHSVSHHDANNFFSRFKKYLNATHNLEQELIETKAYLERTTPKGITNIIVSSNHNDHLRRWLMEADPRKDLENAPIYHELMSKVIREMIKNPEADIDPFELWLRGSGLSVAVEFTSRSSRKILGIEIGLHGDKGPNGSRGTRAALAKLPEKCIIGHSHSPGWEKGCVQVGTSSRLDMPYVVGSPSSWRHCHCVIHRNGKRQLIFIQKYSWR